MGRTLFGYIFKDLLRIFLLTSGVLAGIMSFGGLLRPLTQHGLDAGQVAKMLYYFMPAMSTYSLPIAALFATTVVYGRLSADNELVAMRAGGISHLVIATPALLLGMTVALASLLLLSFIVPTFTLKVEQVIYSNLAKLVANRIERTHELDFGQYTVFAKSAVLRGPDPAHPTRQRVDLIGPVIKTYEKESDGRFRVPDDFYLAQSATVFIEQDVADDEVEVSIALVGGMKFPRDVRGSSQGGIGKTSIGPYPLPSPIRENTKFMDIGRLKELYSRPDDSRRVRHTVKRFIRKEQQSRFRERVRDALDQTGQYVFDAANGERYELS
ncbi:MAG: LptF/LptG family permease, partial [Tepidisphaeraceae bacterium]